jgi:hypothetical protein
MLNGKYDHFFPEKTSQQPFFRLLGTPKDQKRYVVYEGGHFVPKNQTITESLNWLDKYLGPVRQTTGLPWWPTVLTSCCCPSSPPWN